MKTHIISLLFLLPLLSFGQTNRIFGEAVVKEINFLDEVEFINAQRLKMYYSVDTTALSEKVAIKNCCTDNVFEVTVSDSDLEKYKFVFFTAVNAEKVVQIDTILNVKQKIILDKVVFDEPGMIVKKPAIYLYPTAKEKVSVIHNFKGKILNTYPAYNDGWHVVAQPNGKLLNTADNKEYNYLFWDGEYHFPTSHYDYSDGFYVKNTETIAFLQEKLSYIGLNNTEINDFIVFWLPLLNKNKTNFIHFRINDNIDNSSVLNISPKPDTEIRVFMEFKPADFMDETDNIPEQILPKLERKGFTVVEWGGAEMENINIE